MLRSLPRGLRAAVLAFCVACGPAAQPPPATGTLTTETLPSPTLGDDLLLRIRTPAGVAPESGWPVVFVLDPTFAGLAQFDWTVGLASEHEADGSWPPLVVVGLDYDDPNKRVRDYLPTLPLVDDFAGEEGADRFYAALREDVLPHVDATLAVDPNLRVLQGHSNGGSFSWYAALRHRDGEDPPFSAHIAADSGIPQWMFTMERWHAELAPDLPLCLFASRASANGAIQEVTFDGLIGRLRDRDYPGFSLHTAVLNTDHGGAVAPSIEQGLDACLPEIP